MVSIRLTNSMTRKREVFTPLDPADLRLYLCGPTVYDRAHLGNARPVVTFDVLQRLLRHVYGEKSVTYVRNFTDVDDKINAEARRRRDAGAPGTLEELIRERTEETIRWYHEDMAALGAAPPDHEPRATDYIGQMQEMIGRLIASGHAYEAEGHVLFDVHSYDDYGRLSGRSVDDMIAGARVEVAPFKRDPMDFVLWKPSSDDEPGWDSPWGRGRPGWHIECSAMSAALLGEDFDIHGGGLDLLFPHHENEVAQSCCAHPRSGFARYWLHNEMLQVEGRKMSKSLGNFFTVRDLLDQEIPGEIIRYVFLMTHYRRPMDWTASKVHEARSALTGFRAKLVASTEKAVLDDALIEALADDLNTPRYLSLLHEFSSKGELAKLRGGLEFLGFDIMEAGQGLADPGQPVPEEVRPHQMEYRKTVNAIWRGMDHVPPTPQFGGGETAPEMIDMFDRATEAVITDAARYFGAGRRTIASFDTDAELTRPLARTADALDVAGIIEGRKKAREEKDYGRADALRDRLAGTGIELRDTPKGTVWRGVDR